jgi:hypothetical protein
MSASHPLVLGLFDSESAGAAAARALRALGLPRQRVSIVARSHAVEGQLADVSGASPGTEIEDSPTASRAGELSGYMIAAVAMVLPGIGPIVAGGPLAADLGEAAGHLAGGVAKALEAAGLDETQAEQWQEQIGAGAVLVGAHVDEAGVDSARLALQNEQPSQSAVVSWPGELG